MNLPAPFAYPPVPHERKHGPSGYQNYQDYKPWLRDDFTFRCVYCLEREMWYPDRAASFSVDHVVPQSIDASRVCDYSNLVYACTRCNSARQDAGILDPTATALGGHLQVAEDGAIRALTVEGQDLIDLLHLDRPPAVEVRRYHLQLLALKSACPEDQRVDALFVQAFRYPDELPDLTALRPPGGNARDKSEKDCYHALRVQGKLAHVY